MLFCFEPPELPLAGAFFCGSYLDLWLKMYNYIYNIWSLLDQPGFCILGDIVSFNNGDVPFHLNMQVNLITVSYLAGAYLMGGKNTLGRQNNFLYFAIDFRRSPRIGQFL